MRRTAVVLSGVLFVLASTKEARADVVTFSLSGDAGKCADNATLRAAVEQRLQRTVFAEPADQRITIELERGEAHIVETDRHGREVGRRDVPLPEDDCPKTIDTLAVVLAIMIGPPRPKEDEEVPLRSPPAIATIPARERKPPRPPPRPPPRWSVSPSAAFVVGGGILPEVAWGIEAGAIVRPPAPSFFLFARGAYWPPRATGTSVSGEITRLSFAMLGCVEPFRSGEASFALCGGADVGRLHAETPSLTRSSESTLLLDLLAEARFGYRIESGGALAIEPALGLQVAALLRRDRFTYRDAGGRELTLLQPAPVAVQGSFGVTVHFL